jgi:flagellar motor switch protein FliM
MAETDAEDSTAPTFTMGFAEQVLQVGCALDGVIGRLRLPLGRIMALQPDEVLALPLAALDAISLETTDGRSVARARLGQNRGMRALKLYDIESQRKSALGFSGYSGLPPAPDPEPLAELRATG